MGLCTFTDNKDGGEEQDQRSDGASARRIEKSRGTGKVGPIYIVAAASVWAYVHSRWRFGMIHRGLL